MRRIVLVLGMIVFGFVDAGPTAGQEVGQPITLAGCLVQEDEDGDEVEFLLDNVTGPAAVFEEIELVPAEGVELAAHVGHMVEVSEGKKAPNAKPLKGIVKGAGVLEITEDHDSDTYRVVYTVRFPTRVYVLHSFQKKSRKGVATPRHEIDLIRRRYEMARAHYHLGQEDL